VVEIPQIIGGEEAFKRRYVCKRDSKGHLFWQGMEATEEQIKWQEKNWKKTLKDINKKVPNSFDADANINKMSTGLPDLDRILGGGLAEGRMIEVYGENSTGKTTLALQIAAHFQSKGLRVAYMDAEQGIDKQYAEAIGVDFSKLLLDQSNGMEDTIEAVRGICRDGTADLIIVDSIAALLPTSEHEGMAGDANMAVKAKLMAQWCRMIPGNMAKNRVTVLFINQIRNFSTGWGSSEYTPGGNSMKFAAFQRLCLRLVSKRDKTESRDVKITCVKNKLFQPYEECVLHIDYGNGFINTA
jgi:recombination protein RecA